MVPPSNYNVEVESILGGLESALARGQPLNKAMASFRNAGYKEENIRGAARKFQILHKREFQELGIDPNKPKKIVGAISNYGGSIQNTREKIKKAKPKKIVGAISSYGESMQTQGEKIKKVKSKALATSKTHKHLIDQYEREKMEIDGKRPLRRIQGGEAPIDDDLRSEQAKLDKMAGEAPRFGESRRKQLKKKDGSKKAHKPQVVSGYGDDALRASENFRAAIDEMVQSMSKLTVPGQLQPSSGNKQKPRVVKKISNYGMKPPTPVNKAVTFLLIFLLILLLGVLAAVFFFREELIDLFNSLSLELFFPLI